MFGNFGDRCFGAGNLKVGRTTLFSEVVIKSTQYNERLQPIEIMDRFQRVDFHCPITDYKTASLWQKYNGELGHGHWKTSKDFK